MGEKLKNKHWGHALSVLKSFTPLILAIIVKNWVDQICPNGNPVTQKELYWIPRKQWSNQNLGPTLQVFSIATWILKVAVECKVFSSFLNDFRTKFTKSNFCRHFGLWNRMFLFNDLGDSVRFGSIWNPWEDVRSTRLWALYRRLCGGLRKPAEGPVCQFQCLYKNVCHGKVFTFDWKPFFEFKTDCNIFWCSKQLFFQGHPETLGETRWSLGQKAINDFKQTWEAPYKSFASCSISQIEFLVETLLIIFCIWKITSEISDTEEDVCSQK